MFVLLHNYYKYTPGNKTWIIFLLLFIAIFSCKKNSVEFPEISGLQKVETFEGGFLYKTNSGKFHVISLNGTYRQMGRQYGYLLRGLMADYYQEVEQIMLASGISTGQMNAYSTTFYALQPYPFKQIIDGMSENSGLGTLRQHIVCSAMSMMTEVWPGCSGIEVWNEYSLNRKMICGRNWDALKGRFDQLGKYLVVVVYNPGTYVQSVAEVNYAGSMAPQTLINEKGLYLDLHSCLLSDSSFLPGRLPAGYLLFSFLLNSTNMSDISRFFTSTRPGVSLLVNAASPTDSYCFQWPTYGLQQREPDSAGLLVATNHFVNYPSEWPVLPIPEDPEKAAYTVQRYHNLINLAWQNKGNIDAGKMMNIMDVTIPKGGATFPDTENNFATFYQIVTVPEEIVWYIKARNYSNWEKIPIKDLFY